MATTKTRVELVQMAADYLMIVGSGQSLDDEDEDKLDSFVDGLFAELSARGVCDVADDDAIPIEWTSALAELLASDAAPAFGKPKLSPQSRTDTEDRLKVIIKRIDPPRELLKTDLPKGGEAYSLSRWTSGR